MVKNTRFDVNSGRDGTAVYLEGSNNRSGEIIDISNNSFEGLSQRAFVRYTYNPITMNDNTFINENGYINIYYTYGGDVEVSRNSFLDGGCTNYCGDWAIAVDRAPNLSTTNTRTWIISDNNMSNRGLGILVRGNSNSALAPVTTISGNVIEKVVNSGAERGIDIQHLNGVAVTNNTVSGIGSIDIDMQYSYGTGMRLYRTIPALVTQNTITNNGIGLEVNHDNLESSANFSITDNVISGNGDNIRLFNYADVTLRENDLSGAAFYALSNSTSNTIDARNNYWGEDETAEIEGGTNPQALSFIYDSNNSSGSGFVNYAGWLATADAEPTNLTVAGDLTFQKDGVVTTTYQVGDTVTLQYVDADRNADASAADTIDVLVTSDTEDTGTAAAASDPVAGSGNSGDGTVTVSGLGVDTKTETWTLTAISQSSFLVAGSVSGSQDSTLNVGESYTTDGGEVTFLVEQGSLGFSLNDAFTVDTTAGTVVGETITLTETDVDTGIFTADVTLSDSAEAIADNGTLELVPGDRIQAFYTDPQGDFGEELRLSISALYAKTVFGGTTILADRIWDTDGSPYLVTGDVTIPSGVTLTILAGVEVNFLANSDDQSSGYRISDAELLVSGTLTAAGTAEAPVIFKSSET